MKDRKNADLRARCFIEQGKRKPSNYNAANGFVNLGIRFRIPANSLDCFIDAQDELGTQPSSLMLIPEDRIPEFPLGFRVEKDSHGWN